MHFITSSTVRGSWLWRSLALTIACVRPSHAAQPSPPPPAPIVYEGTVAGVYAPAGRARLSVSRVRFPGGLELNLPEPRSAILLFGASGHRQGRISGLSSAESMKTGQSVEVAVRYRVDDPRAPGQPERIKLVDASAQEPHPGTHADPKGDSTPASPPWCTIIFPVLGRVSWCDTYGAPRDGGARKHAGQDLMAPKMRPLVAAFDGEVYLSGSPESNYLTLNGSNGWSAMYIHMNNDHPGTDDDKGSKDYAFAAGLSSGDWVVAGQFLGWVGNSGNAKHTAPHLHFQLDSPTGQANPAQSLRHATHISGPRLPEILPEFRPARGDVRLDGFVRTIDASRGVMEIDLRSVTDARGHRRIVTFPERKWVRVPASVTPALFGEDHTIVPLPEIAVGAPVYVLASGGKGTATARRVLVERSTFVASDELAQAIIAYATELSTKNADVVKESAPAPSPRSTESGTEP